MVHTHLNEMQAIMTFYILKIHTFSNLSELYEISSLWQGKRDLNMIRFFAESPEELPKLPCG